MPPRLVQASWAPSSTYSSHIVSLGKYCLQKILASFEFCKVPETLKYSKQGFPVVEL
jgi:hypothetical protein